MKQEPNNELKAKFFSQYWGQEVLFYNWNEKMYPVGSNLSDDDIERYTIILKPLSSISDEDAIEVVRLSGINDDGYYDEFFKAIKGQNRFATYFFNARPLFMHESIRIYQFLISKGYALEWMGYSVEEQIEAGWIRLID